MKFKTSTLALSATLAAGLASSAFADAAPTTTPTPTPYANLAFETNQPYSVAVGGVATRGSWKEGITAVNPVVENSKVVIDSDAGLPLSFVPDTDNFEFDVTELKFNVEASYVPATVPLATNNDARCGFAIKYDSTIPYYYLFDGSDWAKVSDKTVTPQPNAMFNLMVRLDYRADVKTATYFVEGTEIGTTTLGDKSAVGAIDFVGNGSLSTLNGYKLAIVSEKIEITPTGGSEVTLVIPEQQIAAIKTKAGDTPIATYLNQEVNVAESDKEAVKITRLDAQVLFGKTDAGPTDAAKVKVKGTPAAASSNEKVRVNVVGLTNVKVGGATIMYQLEGSVTGADGSWHNIGSAVSDVTNLEFDKTTSDRFIRVKTSVSYGNK